MKEPITTESILETLDNSIDGDYLDFIDLGHGYFELANCRLTLYKDKNEWAIVFEKFGYNARAGEPVNIELQVFGNSLINLPVVNNKVSNTVYVDIENDIYEVLQKNGDTIIIRDQKFQIPTDLSSYQKYGINWGYDGKNYEGAVLKYLAETMPDLTRATDEELRTCLPNNLKKIMTIDSWHQEVYTHFEPTHPPSTQEAFQMIAEVLVTGDTTKFKPTKKPNTHWSFWPNSGQL